MRKLLTLAFGGLLLVSPSALWSAAFQTNLVFQAPVANPGAIDAIQFDWATNVASGPVERADITDLTMTLLSGGLPALIDVVVSGGVLQPIGGVARVLDDIVFNFDLDTLTLSEVRNATVAQLAGTTGILVVVEDNVSLPVDGEVVLSILSDGAVAAETTDLLASQVTNGPPLATPEPGTASVVFLAVAGFAAWRRIRRRTN